MFFFHWFFVKCYWKDPRQLSTSKKYFKTFLKKLKKSTFPYEFFLHRKILNDFWFSQFSFINLSFNLLLYNILLMQKRFNIHIFYLNFPSYKKKCVPDRFSRFDVYWKQTNKQTYKHTDRQAKFIYRYTIIIMLVFCTRHFYQF